MRLSAILVMISFCGGCRHCMEGPPCDEYCPKPNARQDDSQPSECNAAADVTVKAPRSKVYVDVPAQNAGPQYSNPAPQMAPMQQMAPAQPQMVYAQPGAIPSTGAGQAMLAQTQQTISPPKTRLALGFDFIRIPFPILRFYPVQGPSEVTTTTQYTQVAQPQFAPQYTMVAPQYAMAQPVQAVSQPPVVQIMPQQPQSRPVAIPAAPADCPPVSKETMEQIEQEYQRAKALLDEVEKNRSQNAPK